MRRLVRALIVAYSIRNREFKARHIVGFMAQHDLSTVIFVGVGGGEQDNEAVLERAVSRHATVVASCDVFETSTPWPFVVADGTALPFRRSAVDVVISN